jgi:hypothetical protein
MGKVDIGHSTTKTMEISRCVGKSEGGSVLVDPEK